MARMARKDITLPDRIVSSRINITLLSGIGASGNGKSTLLDLVYFLICGDKKGGIASLVRRIDVSTIIREAARLHGSIGDSARKSMSLMRAGKLVPDEVMIPIFLNWLDTQLSLSDPPSIFLIGGLPRTAEDQLALVRQSFGRVAVFDQPISRDASRMHVAKRLAQAGVAARADDLGGDEVIDQRWAEHCLHTPTIMSELKEAAIPLNRDEPLARRLTLLFNHLRKMDSESPIPQGIVRKCLNRISSNHPIHTEIAKIESPHPLSNTLPTTHHCTHAIPMPGQHLAPA